MTYFTEIDWERHVGGRVASVSPDSLGFEVGLQPGDELLAINGSRVEDIIDVRFYGAEQELEFLIRRDGDYLLIEAERSYGQFLGFDFEHPTFDTDIRRCNNLCEFCFVLQMAPRFRRTLYVKDDDYRYSFLFGHFVTLTNLKEHDWWKIETMQLSPLYVSVHVTDLEKRRQFLRNERAPDIIEQLGWLAARGIAVHTQLVIVPDFNDGEWMARSIQELAGLWPAVRSISVVPVGLTKHHKYRMRTHTREEAEVVLEYVESLQTDFQKRFGVRFAYLTDEWYLTCGRELPPADAYDGLELRENGLGMVRHFLDDWEEVKLEIEGSLLEGFSGSTGPSFKTVTLVTGVLFAPVLTRVAAEFSELTSVDTRVVHIANHRFGDTITAAGLLTAEDTNKQLLEAGYGDLIILPRVQFDHPERISLDDVSPNEMADRLGTPVALADTMGDVWDALIGQSEAIYYPRKRGDLP